MIKILYIQCLYTRRKSGEKTNRCQNVKLKNDFKKLLKTYFYVIHFPLSKETKKTRETKAGGGRISECNINILFELVRHYLYKRESKKVGQYININLMYEFL